MKFDPDIHHRRSIRLRDFDYARAGAYFVTLCVQGRECLFGDVEAGRMVLNDAGEMVRLAWEELPQRYPNLVLDQSMVMPNHFHGILFLTDFRTEFRDHHGRGEPCVRPFAPDGSTKGDHKDRPYGTAPGSVGRIIQAFKSLSTVEYARAVNHQNLPPFPGRLWQRNYYERVIRNDDELHQAREYIAANPSRWDTYDENPVNHR